MPMSANEQEHSSRRPLHSRGTFADLKQDLLNFDTDSCRGQTDRGTSSHFTKDVKCFEFGQIGHRKSECRAKVSAVVC